VIASSASPTRPRLGRVRDWGALRGVFASPKPSPAFSLVALQVGAVPSFSRGLPPYKSRGRAGALGALGAA